MYLGGTPSPSHLLLTHSQHFTSHKMLEINYKCIPTFYCSSVFSLCMLVHILCIYAQLIYILCTHEQPDDNDNVGHNFILKMSSCDFCSGNEEMSQNHVEICGGTWFERRGLDMSTRKGLLDFWRRMTSRLARRPAAVTHGGSSTGDPTWYKTVICSISFWSCRFTNKPISTSITLIK